MADDETFVTFDGTATWMQAHHLCRRVERPVGPNDDLLSGLERLLGTRQDILVVVDQDRVVGVLCEHDVVGLAANMEGPLSFRQRNVGHVLRTVDQHDPARRARYVMANERIRHIVVLEEKRLHSVLSFRDVALEGTLSERRGAGSVGPGRAEFALVGVGVAEAARRMVAKKFGCLPLVDSLGIPVDIVTRTDVIRAVVDALAKT
jgi:CBS domain-containing membrane protein/CBS domain-containing protein